MSGHRRHPSRGRTPALVLPLSSVARAVWGAIAVLAVLEFVQLGLDRGLGFSAHNVLRMFDLHLESSFGTWLSSALLAIAALTAGAHALAAERRSRLRRGWSALAAFLAVLSVDEVATMHEHTQELVFDGLDLPDALVFAWVIPATAIVVAFAAWQRTFFRQLRPWLRRRLVVAGVAYVGAAVGLEIVEGALFAADSMTASTTFLAICGVEEVVEMTAIAVALLALLAELLRLAPGWSLTLTAAPGEAPADSRVGSRVAGTPAFERADAR